MIQLFYSAAETITPAAEQTASASPSLFITIVASAFGGALLTSAVTIWAKFAESKAEYRKWLRDEKLNTYVEYLELITLLQTRESRKGERSDHIKDILTRVVGIISRLDLLAPKQINDKSEELRICVNAKSGTEERESFSKLMPELRFLMTQDLQGNLKPRHSK